MFIIHEDKKKIQSLKTSPKVPFYLKIIIPYISNKNVMPLFLLRERYFSFILNSITMPIRVYRKQFPLKVFLLLPQLLIHQAHSMKMTSNWEETEWRIHIYIVTRDHEISTSNLVTLVSEGYFSYYLSRQIIIFFAYPLL